jgi:hypothetical protein
MKAVAPSTFSSTIPNHSKSAKKTAPLARSLYSNGNLRFPLELPLRYRETDAASRGEAAAGDPPSP